VRNGVATLFVQVEPLARRRHVEVTERRTRQDWARFIKAMLDERCPPATKVRLVMANQNTHDIASLYDTFAPTEARRQAECLEIHYLPKQGRWLNRPAQLSCVLAQETVIVTLFSFHMPIRPTPGHAL
jgi:hypothetical protein